MTSENKDDRSKEEEKHKLHKKIKIKKTHHEPRSLPHDPSFFSSSRNEDTLDAGSGDEGESGRPISPPKKGLYFNIEVECVDAPTDKASLSKLLGGSSDIELSSDKQTLLSTSNSGESHPQPADPDNPRTKLRRASSSKKETLRKRTCSRNLKPILNEKLEEEKSLDSEIYKRLSETINSSISKSDLELTKKKERGSLRSRLGSHSPNMAPALNTTAASTPTRNSENNGLGNSFSGDALPTLHEKKKNRSYSTPKKPNTIAKPVKKPPSTAEEKLLVRKRTSSIGRGKLMRPKFLADSPEAKRSGPSENESSENTSMMDHLDSDPSLEVLKKTLTFSIGPEEIPRERKSNSRHTPTRNGVRISTNPQTVPEEKDQLTSRRTFSAEDSESSSLDSLLLGSPYKEFSTRTGRVGKIGSHFSKSSGDFMDGMSSQTNEIDTESSSVGGRSLHGVSESTDASLSPSTNKREGIRRKSWAKVMNWSWKDLKRKDIEIRTFAQEPVNTVTSILKKQFQIFLADDKMKTFLIDDPYQKLSVIINKTINTRPDLSLETHIATNWKGEPVDLETPLHQIPTRQVFFLKKDKSDKPLDIVISKDGTAVQRTKILKNRTPTEIDNLSERIVEELRNTELVFPTSKKKEKKKADEEKLKLTKFMKDLADSFSSSLIRIQQDGMGNPLVVASLEVLIIIMVKLDVDENFEKSFLMTYQAFVSSIDLLNHFSRIIGSDPATSNRVANFILKWYQARSDVFEDPAFKTTFDHFLTTADFGDLAEKLKGFARHGHIPVLSVLGAPAPILTHRTVEEKNYYDFLDFHPKELARQLTLLEVDILKKIKPSEWLGTGWQKGKSENITAYTIRYNQITGWVSSLVVLAVTKELRAVIITRFLQIAIECLALNNFSTLIAIFLGLNVQPCTRLLQTWAVIDKHSLMLWEKIKEFASPLNKFKTLRRAQEEVEGSCVPYLGVYIGDLTMIEEVVSDKTEDGLINFSKFQFISRIISKCEIFKSKLNYKLSVVSEIVEFLSGISLFVLPDDTMEKESCLRETREENNKLKLKK